MARERRWGVTILAVAVAGPVTTAAIATPTFATAARHAGSERVEIRGYVTASASVEPGSTPIDMSADPYCRGQHAAPIVHPRVRVGTGGGVAGVLVHVTNAPGGTTGGAAGEGEASAGPVLDQSGCMYAPDAIAVRVGQPLVIRNSDQTLHNVRVGPEANRAFNFAQPMRGMESRRTFDRAEVGIPVQCDIHGWMTSTIHVLDHGYYAITGEDGSFELPDLPAGEYTIEAWHPELGASTRTRSVTGGATAEISFELGG